MSWTMSHRNYVVIPGQVPSTRCWHIGSCSTHSSPTYIATRRSLTYLPPSLSFSENISSAPWVIFLFLQSNADTLRLNHGTSLSRRHSRFPYLRLDGFDEPKPPICIIIKLRPPGPHPIQLFSNGITETLLLCDPVLAVRSVSNGD